MSQLIIALQTLTDYRLFNRYSCLLQTGALTTYI